jgi:hypothetical protein
MTLNISLRVPDGIVLASDSLATVAQSINQKINVKGQCDKCGGVIEIKDVQTPSLSVPASTWPYAQKLFPMPRKFGLTTYGWAFVNARSMYNHVLQLTSDLLADESQEFTFDYVSTKIGEYFHGQLKSQLSKTGIQIDLQPDNWFPFGFQFVGFSKDAAGEPIARSRMIKIGKNVASDTFEGIGCSVTGDGSVVQKLWPGGGNAGANFQVFSLQDAIDYARFLISTTSQYQRFSGNLPTVGGEIDVALVTSYRGFRWISQKALYQVLEKEPTQI